MPLSVSGPMSVYIRIMLPIPPHNGLPGTELERMVPPEPWRGPCTEKQMNTSVSSGTEGCLPATLLCNVRYSHTQQTGTHNYVCLCLRYAMSGTHTAYQIPRRGSHVCGFTPLYDDVRNSHSIPGHRCTMESGTHIAFQAGTGREIHWNA
eukprot:3941217-Rhodomonas_salina.12